MLMIVVSIIVLVVVVEAVSYLIYRSGSFKDIRRFYDTVLKKKREGKGDISTFSLRYTEHPFLGLSLNPDFKDSFGEKIHNKYGFRHKDDFEDVKSKDVIYCPGGSMVYCNLIEKNSDTWPNVLENKLKDSTKNENIQLVNAACGGWTSYQSLIRFTAWIDTLKPKLLIMYHGKNDFVPFISGKLSQKELFPDYSNVMHSLHMSKLVRKLPHLAKFSHTTRVLYGAFINRAYMNVLLHIYGLKRAVTQDEAKEGLERITESNWESIMSRYKSFAALCKSRNIPILFVTQKVKKDLYRPYMSELNRRIKQLENRQENCFVYDFENDVRNDQELFYDDVHFNVDGAKLFADRLNNYIENNIPLFKPEVREIKNVKV